ncbi:hypothetical protein EDC04DRAFT_2639140 [Pisolithus marmoratus]|nr:hypothetical protein EDC04DRAFT_2639140 [Pisolithus marmoratus]
MGIIARMTGSTFMTWTCVEKLELTSLAVIGCIIGCIGSSIRVLCYRTLGRLFTFEFTILQNHKLITTGPYAIVRHPSYIGAMFTLTGTSLVYGTRGSMMYHCPVMCSVWAPLWTILVIVSCALMTERCLREDRVLHATFGREWEEWSQRVKWRLVPWVF